LGFKENVVGCLLNLISAKMMFFIILSIILLFKPYGLLGEKEKP